MNILPEALTRRLADYCASAASYQEGLDTHQLDCYRKPGHEGLHYDINFDCYWYGQDDQGLIDPEDRW